MIDCNRDVIVGTTHILDSKIFMKDLRFLDTGKAKAFYTERETLELAKKAAVQRHLQKQAAEVGASASPTVTADSILSDVKRKAGFLDAFGCGCMGPPPPPPSTSKPVARP